jgi:hypothetical protein
MWLQESLTLTGLASRSVMIRRSSREFSRSSIELLVTSSLSSHLKTMRSRSSATSIRDLHQSCKDGDNSKNGKKKGSRSHEAAAARLELQVANQAPW